LGVKTSQPNCNQSYEDQPKEINQLEYLSHTNQLNKTISDATNLNKMHALNDESIALELRIKSYLDSNCTSCHRAGGVKDLSMDLRYELPLILQNTVKNKTLSQASNQNNFIIEPGDHSISELWLRDSSMAETGCHHFRVTLTTPSI